MKVSSHMGLKPDRQQGGGDDMGGQTVYTLLSGDHVTLPWRQQRFTVVVHHSGLLLGAVHRQTDDLHLHEGVDDLNVEKNTRVSFHFQILFFKCCS